MEYFLDTPGPGLNIFGVNYFFDAVSFLPLSKANFFQLCISL